MTSLKNIFRIEKNDIISITGSGGKTSLMFDLAKELAEDGSVLITTSTKIYEPTEGFDRIFTDLEFYEKPRANEIVVVGEKIPEKNKLKSPGLYKLLSIIDDFDYVLIEADGSRNLPLKFWYDHEPVIYDFTTKTIGVIPISSYGKIPDPSFIYNFEGFKNYILEDVIYYLTYIKLIAYKDGMFKGFRGDRTVFINQVESHDDFSNVGEILEHYKGKVKMTYGSIRKGEYYEN